MAYEGKTVSEFMGNKKYESFKIPEQQQFQEIAVSRSLQKTKPDSSSSLGDEPFYVIDYEATKIPGAGKFVLHAHKIKPPENDEIKNLFHSMRDISRTGYASYYGNNRFFDKRVQREKAIVFYKQGMFMKDFTDTYDEEVLYKEYFPCYQSMGYEQLRAYFSWRTEVRKGNIKDTSLSYAFIYLYELINNIGVESPKDGLDQLMTFWKGFSVYDKTIEKYVLRWLKDYHIYYMMPQSFKEFADKNSLSHHYPKMADTDNAFDLFCAVSKYDIRKSIFFTEDRMKLIADCFNFVIRNLRKVFEENGINFDESIFQPTKKMAVWQPFKDAVFHNFLKQPDRRVVLSENEIYICTQNNWVFNSVITSESGRQLIGYIIKQIESDLRTVTSFKYKLNANAGSINHMVVDKLREAGLNLEHIITSSVNEFYRETTKTVVKVDHTALTRIRLEAMMTQEKLIVEEIEEPHMPNMKTNEFHELSVEKSRQVQSSEDELTKTSVWEMLKNAFTDTERKAISIVLTEESDLKRFADDHGVMLEVLVDGINEKSMDFVGDNLMDDDFRIYDEYINQVKEIAI